MKQPHHNFVKLLSLIALYGVSHSGARAEVSAGGYHTCAVAPDNRVHCWGFNGQGQTDVPKITFNRVSAGELHTCGIKTDDGKVICWGDNNYGQSGPIPDEAFKDISAGVTYTCGVKLDGSIACWGDGSSYNQTTPPQDNVGFEQVSAGRYHTCGVKTDRSVVCWGSNWYGQSNPPSGTFKQVSVGEHHTCGLKTDGTIACWGYNGNGRTSNVPEGFFEYVTAGRAHSCGIRKNERSVVCWGSNESGQTNAPEGIFDHVDAGKYHTCGIKDDGSVVCWGRDVEGQSTPPPYFSLSCTATYSNQTRQLILPCLEIPLYLDPAGFSLDIAINSAPIGLYLATLEIPFGFLDFEVTRLSLRKPLLEPQPKHAKFDPDTGVLTIPQARIPSIVPSLNPDLVTSGPQVLCEVKLEQSVLRPEVFNLGVLNCTSPTL